MDTLKQCVKTLKTAITDTEKLAALLVIAKIAPKVTLTKEFVGEIYGAVTSTFLVKLLRSKQINSDQPRFRSPAIQMCCLFAQTEQSLISDDVISVIFETFDENDNDTVAENLEVFDLLSQTETGCRKLAENNIFTRLKLLLISDREANATLTLFKKILTKVNFSPDLLSLLNELSKLFRNNQEIEKFHYLQVICDLISYISHLTLNYKEQQWIEFLKELIIGSTDVLKSRVRKEFKRLVVTLMSNLTSIFGGQFLLDKDLTTETFVLLLMTVTSIEIGVVNNEEFVIESDVMTCSCTFTWSLLVELCSDNFQSNALATNTDFILKLFKCINNVMMGAFSYLRQLADDTTQDASTCQTPLAVIALVCMWATEDTESLRKEFKESLAAIFTFLSKTSTNNKKLMDPLVACISQNIHDKGLKDTLSNNIHVFIDYLLSLETTDTPSVENTIHLLHLYTIVYPTACSDTQTFVTLLQPLTHGFPNSVCSYAASVERIVLACSVVRLSSVEQAQCKEVVEASAKCLLANEAISEMWIILLQNVIEICQVHSLKECISTDSVGKLKKKLKRSPSNVDDVVLQLNKLCI